MGEVMVIVFIFLPIIFIVCLCVWVTRTVTPAPSRTAPPPRPTDTELISDLPAIYYGLAILCGITLLIFTAANRDELSSTEIGAWVGYTVGGVLSMFAVGRVIELLQQIRDAVRNTPALSPGRSDESNPPEPRTGDKS